MTPPHVSMGGAVDVRRMERFVDAGYLPICRPTQVIEYVTMNVLTPRNEKTSHDAVPCSTMSGSACGRDRETEQSGAALSRTGSAESG